MSTRWVSYTRVRDACPSVSFYPAHRRYGDAEAILLGEARLALEERPLPD
jgi:hypothetical protein